MKPTEQVSTNPQSDAQAQDGAKELTRAQQILAAGIENFVPSCVVCLDPVPAKRARGRSKDTCGPDCHKVLRKYREYVLRSGHCVSCYHPSTPEERKDYLEWRKHRGDRRANRGRPKKKKDSEVSEISTERLEQLISIVESGARAGVRPEDELIALKELLNLRRNMEAQNG
jgi:hypothetical protein